jgi:glycosyltransferase involved in cell wall biosynthesis
MKQEKISFRIGVFAPLAPVAYRASLFAELHNSKSIDLMVYFGGRFGLGDDNDLGKYGSHGTFYTPDIPFLKGYPYRFLKNLSPFPNPSSIFGVINPGVIIPIIFRRHQFFIINGYVQVTNWLIWLACLLFGVDLLFTGEMYNLSTENNPIKRSILRIFFKNCKAFLAIGSKAKLSYLSYGIAKENIFLYPYAVENRRFHESQVTNKETLSQIATEYRLDLKLPIILTVCRLIERKRVDDIILAFKTQSNLAQLVIVGDGPYSMDLINMVNSQSIPNVFFLGFRNQKELSRIFSLASFFVLASSSEPWGLVVNEALCFGLPVILSDKVMCGFDLVNHGVNGFIFPTKDYKQLSEYMSLLINDKILRDKMGKHSLERIHNWGHDQQVHGLISACQYLSKIV